MCYFTIIDEVEFFVVICGEEVDNKVNEEEGVDDCSYDRPWKIIFVCEGKSPRRRDADKENKESDEDVPESLGRVFGHNDEGFCSPASRVQFGERCAFLWLPLLLILNLPGGK